MYVYTRKGVIERICDKGSGLGVMETSYKRTETVVSLTLKDTNVFVSRIITASCDKSGTLTNNTPPRRNTLRHRRNTTGMDSEGGGDTGGEGGTGTGTGGAAVMLSDVVVLEGLLEMNRKRNGTGWYEMILH